MTLVKLLADDPAGLTSSFLTSQQISVFPIKPWNTAASTGFVTWHLSGLLKYHVLPCSASCHRTDGSCPLPDAAPPPDTLTCACLGLAPSGQLVSITPQQNKLYMERFFFFISSNSPLPPLHKYTENKWNHPTNISLTRWAPSSLPSFPHCFVLSYFRHLILPPSLPSNVLPPVCPLQDPFRHLALPTEEACYFPRSLIASLQSAARGSFCFHTYI